MAMLRARAGEQPSKALRFGRSMAVVGHLLVGAIALLSPALAAPQDTDLSDVTAEIAFLRQYNGVLHLGIVLHNSATKEASARQAIDYSQGIVVDAKANQKF